MTTSLEDVRLITKENPDGVVPGSTFTVEIPRNEYDPPLEDIITAVNPGLDENIVPSIAIDANLSIEYSVRVKEIITP